MRSSSRSRFRGTIPLYLSLAAHALVGALFITVTVHMNPRFTPAAGEYQIAMLEVAGGSSLARSTLIIAPHSHGNAEKPRPEPRPSVHAVPRKQPPAKASGSASQAARAQDYGTSSAAGNGTDTRNATFPFPIYSPKPPIADRTLIPATDRQVIVDVKLNATGDVIDETLVTGIGNALDQLVLTAVKSWRFQPATVNGQAVPSEAEVIFTFGPHYPVAAS